MSPLSFGNKENTMAIKKLGTIVNTFGLKGQVKVSVTTSQPEERFKVGSKVLIKSLSGEEEEFIVKSLMIKNSKIVILGFEGSKSLCNHDIGIQLGVKIGYKVAL